MNSSQLKAKILEHDPNSNFFSRENMRYFGDNMKNFGVRMRDILTPYDAKGSFIFGGVRVSVYELYRKKPVKHGLNTSSYWSVVDFSRVFEY